MFDSTMALKAVTPLGIDNGIVSWLLGWMVHFTCKDVERHNLGPLSPDPTGLMIACTLVALCDVLMTKTRAEHCHTQNGTTGENTCQLVRLLAPFVL